MLAACGTPRPSGRSREAAAAAARLEKTASKTAQDWLKLGDYYQTQPGRIISARQAYQNALALTDDRKLRARALLGMGELWHRSMEYSQAINCYHQSIALDPTSASAFMHLGVATFARDRTNASYQNDAMELLAKARSLDPGYGDPVAWQGLICHARGNVPDAIVAYETALNLRLSETLKGDVLKELGRAYLQNGMFEDAESAFLRLQRECPGYDGPVLREQIRKTRELIKKRDKGKRLVEKGAR